MTAQASVVFRGDAHDLNRAGQQATRTVTGVETAAKRSSAQVDRLGASAEKNQGKLTRFARSGAAAFGAAGLAYGIKSSIDAFKDAQVQMARVSASLHTLGVDNADVRKHIEDVTLAQQRLSGFQDDELQRSFATILRSTKDVNEALRINAIVADFARGSGKDLNAVAAAFAKLTDGNVNALARYGIKAEKGATITEVLAKAQKRYAGQAEAYGKTVAGQADIAAGEFNNLQEVIGSKFAPALNAAAGGVLSFTRGVDGLSQSVGGLGPLVAGAGGFGAFHLVTPVAQKFGGFLGTINTNARAGGGGMRGFGKAVAGSISPLGLAGIGAGILAGGIYAIWKNSENADQAVQGLNDTLRGTATAREQREVAENNVNASKDYVKATGDAVKAARERARSLHGERQELIENVKALKDHGATNSKVESAQTKVNAKTKEWRKALDDIVPAVHAQQAAVTGLTSAKDNLATASGGVTDAEIDQARKSRDVIAKARENANAAAKAAAVQTVSIRAGAAASGLLENHLATAGQGAETFARLMDKAAGATKRSDHATRDADTMLATFARRIGRIPTVREIKIVTKYAAQGLTLNQIQAKIDAIQRREVTVRFNATWGATRLPLAPITPKSPPAPKIPYLPGKGPGSAGGAWVAGRYGDGDRVPAMVAGEEAILNPRQQALVDGGMTVRQALHATGAPTIGTGFAGGKAPSGHRATDGTYGNGLVRKGGRWFYSAGGDPLDKSNWVPLPKGNPRDVASWIAAASGSGLTPANTREDAAWWVAHTSGGKVFGDPWHRFAKGKQPTGYGPYGSKHYVRSNFTGLKRTTPTAAAQARSAIERRKTYFALQLAKTDQDVANAAGTETADDDVAALNRDIDQRRSYQSWLGKLLRNPAKTMGFPSFRLTASERTDLIGEQTSQTRAINDDARSIFELLHPDAPDADADAAGDAAAAGAAGPDSDQDAILAQTQQRLAVATRSASLSEAELAGLRSSGDIGTGGYANALQAGSGAAILVTLGDQRSLAAIAGAATAGLNQQPSVPASRQYVGIS